MKEKIFYFELENISEKVYYRIAKSTENQVWSVWHKKAINDVDIL